MRRKYLSSLATIHSGYPFRGRLQNDPTGEVRVLQIRDLRLNDMLNPDDMTKIKAPRSQAARLLEPGDIIIPARGEHYRAISFNLPAPTIASSQLLTLRVTSDEVLSDYLCWALNQAAAQHTLRSESRGSNIPLLSRQSLGAVSIPVPALTTQKKIIELQQLWEQEQQLTKQLLANRETMLKGMFQQLMFQEQVATDITEPNGDAQ
jgi:restriction endonuclease S subunit